ncbi:MAG: alkaline phosphatase family protein [Gemmatimonadaceae bacterium]
MRHLLALSLLVGSGTMLAAQQATPPRRELPDPGVIATNQQVNPAGLQSVFEGRVTGTRFAAEAGHVWVAVTGGAFLLDWVQNRVVARVAFDGRAGVHGVSVDPVTGAAYVSSVGRIPSGATVNRLPGAGTLSAGALTQLHVIPASARGESWSARSSGPIGDFMAGNPAVAATGGSGWGGRRLAVVTLPANDQLAILDADRDSVLTTVAVGVAPIDAVIARDGSTAWVSSLGGPSPRVGDRSASQCCDARAERVRIDDRGLAAPGSVSRVDLASGKVTLTLAVGRHPTGLAWDRQRERLYLAEGNDDAVAVIDTRAGSERVLGRIPIKPFKEQRIGLAPTAVALAPDGRRLYVTLGGVNAVAMYELSDAESATGPLGTLQGLIPTGWYPTSVDASADGRYLVVGSLFGRGSGDGKPGGAGGRSGRYVHAYRGSVNVIEVPTESQRAAYTTAVAANNRLALMGSTDASGYPVAARSGAPRRAVPERPGEPSAVQHVVFIIRENRTYDQVLGDIGKGASDSSLTMYGRDVTPNAHALAEQFVLFDHFFASGGNSADGHQWLTQANETEYPMWPLYEGRSYPSEGNDPLTYSAGGFLWETAQASGKHVQVFGEYAPAPSDSLPRVRANLMEQWLRQPKQPSSYFRGVLKTMYRTKSEIPSLDRALVREYPGWTQEVPDVVKAEVVLDHIGEWENSGTMPHLVMIILPSDHTVGTNPGWCTPRACVADNDHALGMMVDRLSHSKFWPSMAILVVEDDAQDGVDHIDGHRTVALAISPWARRGVIDSTFYNQPSMVKTIELMLGLPALSLFDLTATDMRRAFVPDGARPDLRPFVALAPRIPLDERNVRVGSISGPHAAERRQAALASSRMRFDIPDAAPSDRLNRILWHEAKGWSVAYPGVKRSLFFPLSVDLEDDEREEKNRDLRR